MMYLLVNVVTSDDFSVNSISELDTIRLHGNAELKKWLKAAYQAAG